jgi:hypothetical protein
MIKAYANNIFTHDGQSTVQEFGKEIMDSYKMIAAVPDLIVIAGYHGNTQGDWDHDFNAEDITETQEIAKKFGNAKVEWIEGHGMTEVDIKLAFERGNVFFTWCDSDKKIRSVMGI